MLDTYTLTGIVVGAIFIILIMVMRYVIYMFGMYYFFNEYVGYVHAHYAVNYKKARRLYRRLSTIRKSVNGDDLFDIALITYSRRTNDTELYEKTKAMLHVLEPSFYKKSTFQYQYTEAEVQQYVYNLTGFSNKPDMLRFLLWLMVISPLGVRRLNEIL